MAQLPVGAEARRGIVELLEQRREVQLRVAAGHRLWNPGFQRINDSKEQVQQLARRGTGIAPDHIEQRFGAVSQLGEVVEPHRRGHALEGVHAAKDRDDRLGGLEVALPLQQGLSATAQVFPALRLKERGVAR